MNKYPLYLNLTTSDLLQKAESAKDMMRSCRLCPRNCGIDRTKGEKGFCKTDDNLFVSSWGPHFGEERPITGMKGSGTIFFGNCNLGCIFCQNYSISHEGEGMQMSEDALADVMISLQNRGCHNVNLVTPTHQMPMILYSLIIAIDKGLTIPIVYNCGGYESLDAIKLLDGIVDIYMPDFKFSDKKISLFLAYAPDYFDRAREALIEMHRQVGDLIVKNGIAYRGILVRHLVLPDNMAGSRDVLSFISSKISPKTFVNIMEQYYPCYRARGIKGLDRRITKEEYNSVIALAKEFGLI